ncbi:MAG: aldose 1-epimerase [Pseudomonadota bacterium]|nr:aldose 1-epimerase [Pseudomonadota bacterium]
MTDFLNLAAGPLALRLAPQMGGGIARFDWIDASGTTPILRGQDAPASVLDMASFPLVPFVNRIRGGRFDFQEREIRLAPNMCGDPSPLHGQGWLSPWKVESACDDAAELGFVHPAGEWPWDYEAHQSFQLDATGLTLALTCRNLSDAPMPCGLGQHPYFPCTATTRLDTAVTHVWTIDAQVLPVEKIAASGRYDLRNRAICGQDLDHGFAGWSGQARIHTAGAPFAIRMSSPTARFFQLYSPRDGSLFVAEPVSHANAALNAPEECWPELGMEILEPGETARLEMRIAVAAAQR